MSNQAVKVVSLCVICGLFAVSVFAGVVASQTNAISALPTATNQLAILVTTITGFASMLVTLLFQSYRENRNRKWDLADRATARAEMRQHAETQRVETIQTAIELARVSNINRDDIRVAIDKNTELTAVAAGKAEAAYTAANDFNVKLEALHQELANLRKRNGEAKG